jgi:DNA-binding transcriptional LysR family regulator
MNFARRADNGCNIRALPGYTFTCNSDRTPAMDLIQLEIFCSVFKERSFSRAAEALGLAQPTISIRIKEFEAALGTPLFNRLGREIQPTDAGKFLYEQALPLLAQRRALEEKMVSFLDRVEGPLIVGTSSAPGEHLLPGIMMSFQANHPGVHVKLRFASDSSSTLEDLRRGDIDIGIVSAEVSRDEVVSEPFDNDELVLITPPADKWKHRATLTLSELKSLPLIVLDTRSATRATLEQALAGTRMHLSDLKVVAELGRTGAIKEAVKLGYGVAFVSRRAVTAELEARTLRIAQVPELGTITRAFYIVHDRRRELSPTARAFLAHLRQAAPANSAGKTRKTRQP